MDEFIMIGIIIIVVVCCVVGILLVWVIIIYYIRKRQELYVFVFIEESFIVVEYMGQLSYDDDGMYFQQVIMYFLQFGSYQQYQEYQSKESGYESLSGRSRAVRLSVIFSSDVEEGSYQLGVRVFVDYLFGKIYLYNFLYLISFIDNIISCIIFFIEFLCFYIFFNQLENEVCFFDEIIS